MSNPIQALIDELKSKRDSMNPDKVYGLHGSPMYVSVDQLDGFIDSIYKIALNSNLGCKMNDLELLSMAFLMKSFGIDMQKSACINTRDNVI